MATIIADTFTRSDSNTVGAADKGGTWTEVETLGGGCSIVSNACRIGTDNAGIAIYQAHGTLVFPVTLKFKVSAINGNTGWHGGGIFYTGSSYTHLGFLGSMGTNSSNNFGIWNGTAWGIQTQIDLTTPPYWIWVDYAENGANYDVDVYFATSDSKPASPTVSATMSKPAGGNVNLMFDSSGDTKYVTYDDIFLMDSSIISATITDGIKIGEAITSTRRLFITLTDGIKIGDVITTLRRLYSTITDGIKIGDLISEVSSIWTRLVKSVTSFTGQNKNSDPSWTNNNKSTTSWTEENKE